MPQQKNPQFAVDLSFSFGICADTYYVTDWLGPIVSCKHRLLGLSFVSWLHKDTEIISSSI